MNELTKHRQTALHLAAQQDLPTICSVLLENGVDFAAVDENGNNGNFQSLPVCSAERLEQSLPSGVGGALPPWVCSPSWRLALTGAGLCQEMLSAGHAPCS